MKSVLRYLQIFLAIFAMSPFDIIHKNSGVKFWQKKLDAFYYSRLVLILCTIMGQFGKYSNINTKNTSLMILGYASRCGNVCTIIVLIVFSNFYRKKIITCLNGLLVLDNQFKRLNVQVDYSYARNIAYFLYPLFILKSTFPWIKTFIIEPDDLKECFRFIPYIMSEVIITQWVIYLSILRVQFRALNAVLRRLNESKYEEYKNIPLKNYMRSLYEPLSKFGQIYGIIGKQCEQLSNAFVPQFLVIVFTIFTRTIIIVYQTCEDFKYHHSFDAGFVDALVSHSMAFIEIVLPCTLLQEEARKYVNLLHTIDTHGDEYLEELIMTATLQTLHQKIEFSVFCFFPLDNTLLYSILGALTTYLVILLQFDME